MIIQGYFIGDAPYFPVRFGRKGFEGMVRLLADTGASRTTLLDRDVRLLGIPSDTLELARKIERLPDKVTWDDVKYGIYVRQKIEEGLKAADEGRLIPYEEVKIRFSLE